MNSPKYLNFRDMNDLKLSNYLKNWIASIEPPPNGKERLISAALENGQSKAKKHHSKLFRCINVEFDEIFHLRNQNVDLLTSSHRYNLFLIEFGFDPRSSIIFS
jgi:hypothetical protein